MHESAFRQLSARTLLYWFGVFLSLAASSDLISDSNPEKLLAQARAIVEQGDSAGALQLLVSLEINSAADAKLLLERAEIYLKLGEVKKAYSDFQRVSWDNRPQLSAIAHIGIGDCYRLMRYRNFDAVTEYRLALRDEPANCEALYKLAMTGFALRRTDGYRIAARELVNLICINPGYSNAYQIWRDSILDKTPDELRRVHQVLIPYMDLTPGKSDYWLDIASDRYHLDEYNSALEALDNHARLCPDYRQTERPLVLARCMLALDDTASFEHHYNKALAAAVSAEDFAVLLRDAETIFTSRERREAGNLVSSEQWQSFFRAFWKEKDPDPLTPANERLVEHFSRLHTVQRYFYLHTPHSLTATSSNYYREITRENIGDFGFTNYPANIFWGRSRELALDHRGQMYIRHGAPHRIDHPDMDKVRDPVDIWQYGSRWYTFTKKMGAGDYLASLGGSGNFRVAMENQSFDDPLSPVPVESYLADFISNGEALEVYFFQSVTTGKIDSLVPLKAHLAIYDSTWKLLTVDTADVAKAGGPNGDYWWAVHSATMDEGGVIAVLRMELPGRRAIVRSRYTIQLPNTDSLELSGIVLGISPDELSPYHEIDGIRLIPRPSLRFELDEVIRVCLQIYGLVPAGENREYVEAVTVRLAGDDDKKEKSLVSSLWRWGRKRSASMTMQFGRRVVRGGFAVPETFEIDTSFLVPGRYELLVTVKDKNSDQVKTSLREFELVE